jgi:hypothetical protein
MNIVARLLLALVFVAPLVVSASNAPKGYQLYPFPAVIVNTSVLQGADTVPNKLISEDWKRLYEANKQKLNAGFVQAINSEFAGQVTERILKADRNRSLVISLHIVRARHYSIAKPNGTQDVYVPITGSLYFTNPISGEVVLALSSTAKPVQTLSSSDSDIVRRIDALYVKGYESLQKELIAQAKGKFSPSIIETTILSNPLGFAQTSIGTRGGLSQGDQLYPIDDSVPMRLVSCDADSCVGSRPIGEIAKGAVFIKRSSGKLVSLSKPSIFVRLTSPEPALASVWAQVVAENLGEKAPFTVVFVNPDFQYLLTGITAQNEISMQDILNRDPPDLVLDVAVDPSIHYKLPTNLDYKSVVGVTGRAVASIVDRNGNVIYSTTALDAIDDEVTQNIDFNPEDRAEISTKNVLIALAERLATEFKPADLRFVVSGSGENLKLEDKARVLRPNQNYTLYREVPIAGPSKRMLVPIAKVKSGRTGGVAKEIRIVGASLSPEKVSPMAGDVVIVKSVISKAVSTDAAVGSCGSAENRGQIELPNVDKKVLMGLSGGLQLPFLANEPVASVQFLFDGSSGFRRDRNGSDSPQDEVASPDYCISAIQRIEAAERICQNDICQIPVSVRLGASLKKGENSVALKAVEQKVTTSGFHISASNQQQTELIRSTAERAVDSAVVALVKLAKPAFESAIQAEPSKN